MNIIYKYNMYVHSLIYLRSVLSMCHPFLIFLSNIITVRQVAVSLVEARVANPPTVSD